MKLSVKPMAMICLLSAIAVMPLATATSTEDKKDKPAKELFASKGQPSISDPLSIGSYAKGCLAGGKALPFDGPHYQVMRLSRNRFFGHPSLISFINDLTYNANLAGLPDLLVGDMSQPRGGPMLTGHTSHQIGLDADIWFLAAPETPLTTVEREELSAISMVREDWNYIDEQTWDDSRITLLKLAASDDRLARIFVNPAIKRALCDKVLAGDQDWLRNIRPWYGHQYHFHVRLKCPPGSTQCTDQAPPPPGPGCGDELDWWFTEEARNPKPKPPKPPLSLADLPQPCANVLAAEGL